MNCETGLQSRSDPRLRPVRKGGLIVTVPHRTSPLAATSVETAVDMLRARGLRVSAARRLVIEALFAAERPLTAEEIAAGLEGWLPSSDLASVYRNLDTLEELGLVRHFHVGHGAGLYSLASAGDLEFVTCERCGAFEAVAPGPARRRPRADRARAGLPRPVLALPDRRHLRRLRATPRARGAPCTFLTASSRTRSRSPCAVPAVAAVGYGLRRAEVDLDDRRVPLLGVTAAFVFAAQMLNFPVAGGTSGHFLGAALAAVLLGPWLACLVLAVVLVVQAFVFADGGITALGANVFNMGVIGGVVVGGLMLAARRALPNTRGALLGVAAVGAWLAVMAGAAACAVELAISGHRPARHRAAGDARRPRRDRRRRGGDHRRRGQRGARHAARPDPRAGARPRVPAPPDPRDVMKLFTILALAVAVGLATAVSPYASSSPDGLEKVAGDKAFLDQGRLHSVQEDSPVPDYAFPGVDDPRVATGLAGFVGTLLVFGLGYGLVVVARRRAVTA